jgi:hypothetical protein
MCVASQSFTIVPGVFFFLSYFFGVGWVVALRTRGGEKHRLPRGISIFFFSFLFFFGLFAPDTRQRDFDG